MSSRELTKIVPAPKNPVELPLKHAWAGIEQRLGIEFPDDLKSFCRTYGSGSFCIGPNGFLWVYNPFGCRYSKDLEDKFAALNAARERGLKYAVHPQHPGLFPWGGDVDGDTYCWLTEGACEEWLVVLRQHGTYDVIEFPLTMTAFLAKFFANQLTADAWDRQTFDVKELNFAPDSV